MKKGRFLWSAHRITEKQKAGKARNIKEKQLKNSRNTVLRLHVEHLSSQRDNFFHSSACIQFYLHKLEKKIKAFHGQFRERLFVCLKSSDYENRRLNCVKKKDKVCGNG